MYVLVTLKQWKQMLTALLNLWRLNDISITQRYDELLSFTLLKSLICQVHMSIFQILRACVVHLKWSDLKDLTDTDVCLFSPQHSESSLVILGDGLSFLAPLTNAKGQSRKHCCTGANVQTNIGCKTHSLSLFLSLSGWSTFSVSVLVCLCSLKSLVEVCRCRQY